MQSEDRLIHFSTELIHLPKQRSRQALQKLYFDLSQTRAAYDSTDFSQPAQMKLYSKRPPRTPSVLAILPDRAVLVEEWADIALNDFFEKLREAAPRVLTDLGAEVFRAQSVTLRSTMALTHFEDARAFLLDHMCQQTDRIGPFFKRPIETGGLRFTLPETAEHRGILRVSIESFRQNPSEVLVEVKGIFGNVHIDTENVERAIDNVRTCREFIRESVFPFLDQYDTPQEDPV